MRAFELQEPPIRGVRPHGQDPWVSGRHMQRLPAAECGNCAGRPGADGWGDPALCYPHISIPASLKPARYRERFTVTWAEYEELKAPLRELVPAHLPLPPGTEFGPLVGVSGGGPLTDFAWLWSWHCFVRAQVLDRLNQKLGVAIQAVPAQFRSRRKEKPDYLELVALPLARVSDATRSGLTPGASECCRRQFVSGDYFAYAETPGVPIRVKASSLPVDADIFRIRELSRRVLCSERFHNAVLELGFQNINFAPIDLVDE
ncbi:MAG: double-CXXCG motif protein [Verrucomicrobiota bacterium]